MDPVRYPPAKTVDVVDDHHGTKVADPYRWLEDTDADETRSWIEAQNALTESWLSEVGARERIRRRLTELWDHPRAGAPSRRANRWFQLRNTGLQNQDVLYVLSDPEDEGEVLIDPNTMSADGTVALSAAAANRDASLIAYALSEAGSDWMTWRVRDVATKQDLSEAVRWSKFAGAAWLPDSTGFFYGRYDEPAEGQAYEQANRNHQLWLHRVGTSQEDDELVYARADEPDWMFDPQVTEDGRYLVVTITQGTDRRTRVHYADLEAEGAIVPLLDDFDAGYHFVGNKGTRFFFVTDLDAPRRRVIAVEIEESQREHWVELVGQVDDPLEQALVVGGRFVVAYLHHARHRLARFHLDGQPDGEVDLPGIGAVEVITGRPDDEACFFTFASFTQPPGVYRHEIASATTTVLREPGLHLEQSRFVTEQTFVESADGTQVPMFLIRRSDVEATGDVPTLLYGYGGFGISLTPMFRVAWLVWVEMGGLLAIPNLRGGGEYGDEWHDAGRLEHKQNTFDDAIACAEWLIDHDWTASERMGITGGSNGGLLVGACMTQRPDLLAAAVPEVGVLDMLRFHLFTIGWAWTSDYGCADDPEQFAWLHAYSPLHNLRGEVAYPATLVTTGDHDDRVVPGHSFKFAAALQALEDGDGESSRPRLIRIQTQAGHGLGKPTKVLIDERADVLTFLVKTLGLDG